MRNVQLHTTTKRLGVGRKGGDGRIGSRSGRGSGMGRSGRESGGGRTGGARSRAAKVDGAPGRPLSKVHKLCAASMSR